MIWVYVLTVVLFLSIAGFIYLRLFASTKWFGLHALCCMLMGCAIGFLIVAGANQLESDNTNKRNIAEYNEIVLYYDVVNKSNDELLRWDYYQECQEWNVKYENWLMGRQSKWCSAFYGRYDYDGCDFIRL